MAVAAAPWRRDAGTLGLVGAGHFMSHFLGLTLPPLFPFLREEFGLSFTELGLVMTVFAVATGLLQLPVGYLVDRVSPAAVLIGGLTLMSLAIAALGFVHTPLALGACAILAGAANSAFHPSNYSILSSAISAQRMGRAFSLHTFAGHLGDSLAPLTIILIAVAWDWRTAVFAAGVLGLAVAGALAVHLAGLPPATARAVPAQEGEPPARGLALFMRAPLLTLFGFFLLTALAATGLRTFSVTALVDFFATPPLVASAALTGFLFASALGVLLGGLLADRTTRHDLMAAAGFLATALAIAVIGSVPLSGGVLMFCFAFAGLCQGVIRPARDMLARAAAPSGAVGRVFAFLSSGINVGSAIAPLVLGWVVDRGAGRALFWLIALVMGLGLLTVIGPGRVSAAAPERERAA